MALLQKSEYTVDDLLAIVKLLRAPGGCPWDREQTHESIRMNFIEETYEVAEAIDKQDTALLNEELGDVLLQVIFHTCIEEEQGRFDFDDVCDRVCKKLILRHPHIFADRKVDGVGEVLRNWDDIKKKEKQHKTFTDSLNDVPKALPALMRSEKVQARAAKSGFDYPDAEWAMKDLHSEVEELSRALEGGEADAIDEELGDLLFSVVNVSRFVSVNAEQCLGKSCDKFISRFAQVEALAAERGVDMKSADMDLLNVLWQEAKIKKAKNFGGILK